MPGTPHTCTRAQLEAGDTSQCYACQETHGFSTGAPALTAMTPAEVDTLAAPLESALAELHARIAEARGNAYDAERKAQRTSSDRLAASYAADATRYRDQADELAEHLPAALAAVKPYREEYLRRGTWPRIFWCAANGGHAHRSLNCRTLHVTTRMVWLPELSGTDETQLVEQAGEAACTVCYPSAPVDVLARPSTLAPAVADREAAASRKAAKDRERAERAAAKAAKGITAPDGSPLKVDGYVIASEVTARNDYVSAAAEAADHAEGLTGWGHRPDLAEKYAGRAAQLLAALAHKHGRTVEEERAELADKVTARRKKDARERAKYAAQH